MPGGRVLPSGNGTNNCQIPQREWQIDNPAAQAGEGEVRIDSNAIEIRDLKLQKDRLSKTEKRLERFRQRHGFRLMRGLHLWGWLDAGAEDSTAATALPSGKTHRGLRKVVVDLTPVLPGGGNGGAKVMTLELIRHLARLAVDSDFILLTSEPSHDELAALDAANVHRLCVNRPGAALAATDNLALRARSVLARFLPPSLLAKVAGAYRQATEAVPAGNSLVRQLDADLLFCPFTAPFFFDPAVPAVSVVYDLQHAYYPQFFDAAEIQERERNLGKAIGVASGLICISEYVRQTLLEKTAVAPERAEVIHIQLPRRLARPSVSECESVLQSLHLTSGQFLLYPANFWPHKNHELLLTAFGIYLAGHPGSNLKLALTGSPGARQDFLRDAARRMGISHAVLFPGYLPEAELSSLLHSCMAVIFPSLFEGFGMPLLEGMAAGRPLLCSNNTSLPEVAGGAALFFDPRIPAEVADAIALIAGDSDLRRELAAKGAQRLAVFGGPEEMAASYLRTFRRAVRGR
jgi:glycosyltransferase involved in cell wall biosynthesis